MNTELIEIIKYSIYGGELPNLSNWEELSRKLEVHAIVPILWTSGRIKYLKVPEDFLLQFNQIFVNQVRNFAYIQATTNEVTELLRDNDVTPIILKGMAASIYYSNPYTRTVGDIDFLVKGNMSFEVVGRLLVNNGFEPTDDEKDPDVSNMRHDGFQKNGIHLEMHRYFSNKRAESDDILDQIIEEAEPVEAVIDECRFYMLHDSVNGLVLIDHINHHLTSGLGFRQIIDWIYFVENKLTDDLWEREFYDLVEKTNLTKLAVTVTRMCELYLGLSHRKFAEAADDSVCELLMEDIIDAGNFGRGRDNVVSKVAQVKNSSSFFGRLQAGGLSRWKAAQKHKVLRPFAWIYQGFRVSGIMIKRLLSGKSVKGADELANRQDALFKALKIGKYRK